MRFAKAQEGRVEPSLGRPDTTREKDTAGPLRLLLWLPEKSGRVQLEHNMTLPQFLQTSPISASGPESRIEWGLCLGQWFSEGASVSPGSRSAPLKLTKDPLQCGHAEIHNSPWFLVSFTLK